MPGLSAPAAPAPAFRPTTTQFWPPRTSTGPANLAQSPAMTTMQDEWYLRSFGLDRNDPTVALLMSIGVPPSRIKSAIANLQNRFPELGAPGKRPSNIQVNPPPHLTRLKAPVTTEMPQRPEFSARTAAGLPGTENAGTPPPPRLTRPVTTQMPTRPQRSPVSRGGPPPALPADTGPVMDWLAASEMGGPPPGSSSAGGSSGGPMDWLLAQDLRRLPPPSAPAAPSSPPAGSSDSDVIDWLARSEGAAPPSGPAPTRTRMRAPEGETLRDDPRFAEIVARLEELAYTPQEIESALEENGAQWLADQESRSPAPGDTVYTVPTDDPSVQRRREEVLGGPDIPGGEFNVVETDGSGAPPPPVRTPSEPSSPYITGADVDSTVNRVLFNILESSGPHPRENARIDSRQPTTAEVMFDPARRQARTAAPPASPPPPSVTATPASAPAAATTTTPASTAQAAPAAPAAATPPSTVPRGPAPPPPVAAQWRNPDTGGYVGPGSPPRPRAPASFGAPQFRPVNPATGLPGPTDPVSLFAAQLQAEQLQAPDGEPMAPTEVPEAAKKSGGDFWSNPEFWAAISRGGAAATAAARQGGGILNQLGAGLSAAGEHAGAYSRYQTAQRREDRRDFLAEVSARLDVHRATQDPVSGHATNADGEMVLYTKSGKIIETGQKVATKTKATDAVKEARELATVEKLDELGNKYDFFDQDIYDATVTALGHPELRINKQTSIGGQESPLQDSGKPTGDAKAQADAVISQYENGQMDGPTAAQQIKSLYQDQALDRKSAIAALKKLGFD